MSHFCHAEGCAVAVEPKMLFCRRHWHTLPKNLQRDIWTVYVPGQEVRKDPSYAYLVVQATAVAMVAMLEGRKTKEEAIEHVMRAARVFYDRCTPNDRDLLKKVGFYV